MTFMIGHRKNPSCMHLFIFDWGRHSTDYGYVFFEQVDSNLNAAHSTFTSNNALSGGAVYTWVRAEFQQPSASHNSFEDKFDCFVLHFFGVVVLGFVAIATHVYRCILSSLKLHLSMCT